MLTAVTTLVAIILALLGAFWLPDEATRLQGGIAFAVAAAFGVYSFRQTQRVWPRPEPEEAPGPQRQRRTQLIGAVVAVLGLALIGWALFDIWEKDFVWDMAQRWAAGLVLLVIGAYLIGNLSRSSEETASGAEEMVVAMEADPDPPAPPPVIGPRPSGYKLRAIGLDDESEDEPPPPEAQATSAITAESKISPWLEIVLVVVILAAAILFRAYRIDSVPPGIFVDETNAALDALRSLEGRPSTSSPPAGTKSPMATFTCNRSHSVCWARPFSPSNCNR